MLNYTDAEKAIETLSESQIIIIDTETTGLNPYRGDRLFSLQLGSYENKDTYYFNFLDYGDSEKYPVLPREFLQKIFGILNTHDRLWVGHNIKFDLHILAAEGVWIAGPLHDTMVTERVLDYTLREKSDDFSLAKTAKRYGLTKLKDMVDEHFKAHPEHITKEHVWFRKDPFEYKHYDKVPPEIMYTYGVGDIDVTRAIYRAQMLALKERQKLITTAAKISDVYEQEMRLIKTVFRMEYTGVLCDLKYIDESIKFYRNEKFSLLRDFFLETGEPFNRSPKQKERVFSDVQDKWVYGAPTTTGKVNPTFSAKVLKKFDTVVSNIVTGLQKTQSNLQFFGGFKHYADAFGVVRTTLHQHLPCTGRFSSSSPNLQNLTKGEDANPEDMLVRKAIIPRPGKKFLAIDYAQMEYKLMLDYANPKELVIKVRDQGFDIHQAQADDLGLPRKKTKSLNFGLLYGMGDKSVAAVLGIPVAEAKALRYRYLSTYPEIRGFLGAVYTKAENTHIIVNWLGRIYTLATNQAYKAVNCLIQGGCADAAKRALIQSAAFVSSVGGECVLQIHDEFVYEVDIDFPDEHVREIVKILESAYPYKNLPLTVAVEVCEKNLWERKKYEFR